MPRVSGFKKLPPDVRDLIGKLREQGRTLDEILDALRALDISVPRATLGDWTKKIDAVAAKVEQSRIMADALVRRFGDAPESKTARLNMQMMHTALFNVFEQTLEGSTNLSPQEAMQLSKALDHITRAAKTDAEFVSRVREEARKETEERMEAAAKTALAETAGRQMAPEQIAERMRAIYRGDA
jgi:DNA-directed RNA polymerase subunit F